MSLRHALLMSASIATVVTTGFVALPAAAQSNGPESVASISGVTAPPTRGSLPVGSATYPVPSGAVFVDSARGNDSGTGGQNSPMKTVANALDKAAKGGTVVLRAGTYTERVFIGRPVTIQAYPGEAVWFDGSTPLQAWTSRGGVWEAPFTARFDHTVPANADAFVGPQNSMAAWPEMVFVDGRRITQVSSAPNGEQFAIDQSRGKVVLGFDPAGKDVRVTTLNQAVVVGSPDVTLRGFGVRRYANSISTYGAVYLARPRTSAQNIVVEDVATTGITLDSDGTTGSGAVDHVTVKRAGLLGVHGRWADGATIQNSVVVESNYERFNNLPSAAGIKIGQTRGLVIDNNRVSDSYGATGIWLDEAVVNFRVTRNQVGGNGATGISAELASRGTVASNHVVGHAQGIIAYNTEKTRIVNNTVGYNSMADLQMIQDWRRQASPTASGKDPRFTAADPTNTWILRDITVKGNLFGGDGNQTSQFQVYVLDRGTARPADDMNIQITGNAFTPRKSASDPVAIAWGSANGTTTDYDTVQQFERAKRRPADNLTLSTGEFSGGMDESRWNALAPTLTSTDAGPLAAPVGLRAIGSLTG